MSDEAQSFQEASLKRGECPLCGSEDIHAGTDLPGKEGIRGGNRIPVNLLLAVPLDNYVCLGCGLVESYINDRDVLIRISKEWPRVRPLRPTKATDEATDEGTLKE